MIPALAVSETWLCSRGPLAEALAYVEIDGRSTCMTCSVLISVPRCSRSWSLGQLRGSNAALTTSRMPYPVRRGPLAEALTYGPHGTMSTCMMQPAFDLDAPLFTTLELAKIAGINRGVADVWLHRELLKPTRSASVGNGPQGRPLFSAVVIFQAKLIRRLSETVDIGPSTGTLVALKTEEERGSAQIAKMSVEGNWWWAVVRSSDKPKPITIIGLAGKKGGEWQLDVRLESDHSPLCFAPGAPYIVLPLSEIFLTVYQQCSKIMAQHEQR